MTFRRFSLALLLAGATWCGFVTVTTAAVKPHPLFSNGAVLQRGAKVSVWGTATEGEKITVRIAGHEGSSTTIGGKWQVELPALEAGGPHVLSILGENKLEIGNVLVGDVWICSGQSNMEWPLRATAEAEATIASAANPMLRLFTVPRRTATEPKSDIADPKTGSTPSWNECGPQAVAAFSAVGYFFGRDLQRQLNVPIGLIHTSWGGTPAQAWTSRGALDKESALKAAYGGPAQDNQPGSPSSLYNGMIAPLTQFPIKGAIWYQGESNAGQAYLYRTLFPAMINDWRTAWRLGDFPFLYVQLAPYDPTLKGVATFVKAPGESRWAELREAQLMALKLPNTAMAVIVDVGEPTDIHPKKKAPVGARLALAARAVAYGEKFEYSGPVYVTMKVEGNKAALTFTHVGECLEAKGGPLTGFTLCGKDRKFVDAFAEIQGDKVVVSSPEVAEPVAIRYGWADYPVVNLWNKNGLPATPFRTDDFPGITQPKPR